MAIGKSQQLKDIAHTFRIMMEYVLHSRRNKGNNRNLHMDPQITTATKTMFHTSGIGAQQKQKKVAEKITQKNTENVQTSVASMAANAQN